MNNDIRDTTDKKNLSDYQEKLRQVDKRGYIIISNTIQEIEDNIPFHYI